ncbi:hypothetical protein ACRTDU_01265 [Sunxiuqinia elliptica]
MITKEYNIFQNKLKDLESSLSLIDQSLKLTESSNLGYSLKNINLARGILIKNIHISVYELFIQYINSQTKNFLNNIFATENPEIISNFLKDKKKLISQINIEFNDLEHLVTTPIAKIETKIISYFQNKKKDKSFINSVEALMNLELSPELKDNVVLFIAMRHTFVHSNGKINKEWKRDFSKTLHRNHFKLKTKGEELFLPTDYIHLKLAIENYSMFCKQIEEQIIKTPTEAGV